MERMVPSMNSRVIYYKLEDWYCMDFQELSEDNVWESIDQVQISKEEYEENQ